MRKLFGILFLVFLIACAGLVKAASTSGTGEYYVAIFGFTVDNDNQLSSFHLTKVLDVISRQPVEISVIPRQFIDAAREKFSEKALKSKTTGNNQKEMFSYLYFNTATPDRTDIDADEIRKAVMPETN